MDTRNSIVWVDGTKLWEGTINPSGRPDTFYISAGNEHSTKIVYYDDIVIGYGNPGTPVPEFSSFLIPVMVPGTVFLLARYSRKE